MKVLISGGGTGGHIYPALAVAMQLKEKYDADILFLGSDDGLETQLVPAAGLRLVTVKAGKLQRYVSWGTIKKAARVPVGMMQAIGIVRRFHPDVAFTSGGYVAVPAGLGARLSGVPLLMHQQDVPPNLSNKLLMRLASHISVAFADSLRFFPSQKTSLVGNPIRQEILDVRSKTPQEARTALGFDPAVPLLLVTGGSQGARHLNQVVCKALPELLNHCQVLQISGKKLFEETRSLSDEILKGSSEEVRKRYHLVPYMSEEMPLALQAAELVVCRAGASTLSELAVLGKPSILVPLPPGIGASPQEANAAMFGRQGAAEVVINDQFTVEALLERTNRLFTEQSALQVMAEAVSKLSLPDATATIADKIAQMAHVSGVTTAKNEVLSI
uniref:UDP-N-acetylglucosamine--N-acetylmuramyl-(pentapeptide) pyrophosphoryl-undecaprenol N-acetylglucosamine transferase n=1 Tax=Thermosporothrix sp. COM3 TaxID=2490863 RepID=A0A455SSG8_9CHLR|nr:undecaprenyldiphospho-muramoylpentapeptide beta-N- acetylglucosaminyltransferase [Thermosporothrix sp. COM3]